LLLASGASLLRDITAWGLVWDWAADHFEFMDLIPRMEAFGKCYIYEEWQDMFNAIFNASVPEDEDAIDLSAVDLGVPKPLKALQDAMAKHCISFPAPSDRMSLPVPYTSSRTRPSNQKSRRPAKRRKTNLMFLDIAASEGSEEEEENDDNDNELSAVRATAVKSAGHALYAKDLDRIIERYKDGQPRGLVGPSVDRSMIPIDLDLFPSTQSGWSIYIASLFTSKSPMSLFFICVSYTLIRPCGRLLAQASPASRAAGSGSALYEPQTLR
jgi:hypothetical protein